MAVAEREYAEDEDCPDGERCEDVGDGGFCQPPRCESDAECNYQWSCESIGCVQWAFCENDDDCGDLGLSCVNRQCINVGGCKFDDDCPPNQDCILGLCFAVPPLECQFDADCLESEVCRNSFCEPSMSCTITADCPAPLVCSTDQVCILPVECTEDEHCTPPGTCDERNQCS